MIELKQEDIWAFNIINTSTKNAQDELNRILAARDSFIKMLEQKYNADFDAQTGQFNKKKVEKVDEGNPS